MSRFAPLSLLALVITIVAAGCGSTSQATPKATPSVAANAGGAEAQQADVPSNLVECPASGSFDHYQNAIKATHADVYQLNAGVWAVIQKSGATAMQFSLFTDSQIDCMSTPATATPTFAYVSSIVMLYKDQASATTSFTTTSILNFVGAQNLFFQGLSGEATGLGPSSMSISKTVDGRPYYSAFWQNGRYVIWLEVYNLDPTTAAKIATNENAHIH